MMRKKTGHHARRHRNRSRHFCGGFTLVEMIVSAGLVGFLAITATWFWVDGFSLARSINAENAALAEGRLALERLARELRELKFNSSTSSYCIDTSTTTGQLSATRIVFNRDDSTKSPIDTKCGFSSPDASSNDLAVTISLAGSNLNLGYAGGSPEVTRALATNVSSLVLRFLAADAVTALATSPLPVTFTSDVRHVEITLTLRPSGGRDTALKTLVALRNEKR